jgi:hypothetical protein
LPTKKVASTPDGAKVLAATLKKAGRRPAADAGSSAKIDYAVRFAEHIAQQLATDLEHKLKGISATTKRTAASVGGKTKQLDVNFSTPKLGLALGISLKSVHTRDREGAKRYTHNMKRNEEELRIEASGYHKRQPYAVMIGVLFLPFDSCDDGKSGPSSFGSWVRHLRPYTGRKDADDDIDKFERIFVALYDTAGRDLRFFDTGWDPPKNARPRRLLSYSGFLDVVYGDYLSRNDSVFKWDSGEEEPLNPEEDENDEGS